jgi:FMN reductase
MVHILAVSGSPSRASRTAAVLGRVATRLAGDGHTVDVLHLRALPAEPLLRLDLGDPFVADAAERLRRAEAVVLGTPVYQSSFTGLMKVWFDTLAPRAFDGRTVLPLITGASGVDPFAVGRALSPILAGMGAAHVAEGKFLLDRLVVQGAGDIWTLDPEAQSALDHAVDEFSASVHTVRVLPA